MENRKLRKSSIDKSLSGVCGGIAGVTSCGRNFSPEIIFGISSIVIKTVLNELPLKGNWFSLLS